MGGALGGSRVVDTAHLDERVVKDLAVRRLGHIVDLQRQHMGESHDDAIAQLTKWLRLSVHGATNVQSLLL